MSTKAFLTAAAAGALLFGAGSALAGAGDGERAIDKARDARMQMHRMAMKSDLEAAAATPSYYAVGPTEVAFTGPDYYAAVSTPSEFYAALDAQPATQFASIGDALAAYAPTAPVSDASATVNYPQALEQAGVLTAPIADASASVDMPAVEMVSSMPVADTPENRALYGAPLSRAGKMTAPVGN